MAITPEHIAVLTDRKWPSTGVTLTVSFLDGEEAALRARIISHMNAWSTTANVQFVETNQDGQVRIARDDSQDNGGYWSYLGTEIEEIPMDQQTMNLQGFTMDTLESEFHRVVRHETGHTLGFPHEHMRKELVDKIDRQKAIQYFEQTQGWSEQEVIQQVLTPLEDSSLIETVHADPYSIMCYQIPGIITKDGQPIVGGTDIDAQDYDFAAKIYPKPQAAVSDTLIPAGPQLRARPQKVSFEEAAGLDNSATIDISNDEVAIRISLKPTTTTTKAKAMSEKKPQSKLTQTKPTRDIVHQCVISLTGADAQDDAPISSITGLSADDLGGCLNDSIPLRGKKAFLAGDISDSDRLADVTNAADVRRNQP
jgi:astacin (peptidase family M12A)